MSWPRFLRRALTHILIALAGIVCADGIGMIGYHVLGRLPWVDSFLNASMILGGMGPVDRLDTTAAKIFAGLYALFSGLVFIFIMGVVLAPWAHRFLHTMHLGDVEGDPASTKRSSS